MTQTELYNKLWKSDQTEWDLRAKQCKGCKGNVCRSSFFCYVPEIIWSNDMKRARLTNVPCVYADKLGNKVKNGTPIQELHRVNPNLSVYD